MFVDFIKKIAGFSTFNDNRIFLKAKLSFVNISWEHVKSQKKIGPNRFSRLGVYWILTNRHPNKVYVYIKDSCM